MIEFAEDLFYEESHVKFYGVPLLTRMAVVRLSGDRLFVYSPVYLSDEVRRAVNGLGTVAYIVEPNKIHNLAMAEWMEAYPHARTYAPPGLPERRPDLHFDELLTPQPAAAWADELAHVLTAGNVFFSEALFFHRKSGTVMVADFVENADKHTAPTYALILSRPFGVLRRPTASPEFKMFTHDADALAASLAPARAWPIQRIFLCHGKLITEDAQATFNQVADELIALAHKRSALFKRLTKKNGGEGIGDMNMG